MIEDTPLHAEPPSGYVPPLIQMSFAPIISRPVQHIDSQAMLVARDIPREEIESLFKELKKTTSLNILKIYDDGAIKVIDEFGITTYFEDHEEFYRFARRLLRGQGRKG